MAEDCTDADYLGAYSWFFAEFVAKVNPYDQLPVSVSSYNVTDAEIVGEIISVTLQYLNQTQCPPSLQAHLVHQVTREIKSMCKKQPEDCGFKFQEKSYTSLKLMQAITGKVNEICTRYLDNSRLALLPPPPSTPLPQIIAGGHKNCKRRMEDRYAILHDLHATFGISDDTVVHYYAVFDGHAGQDAAVYCATHLHQYLAESIYYPTDPERALRDAFLTTDAQFIEKSKTQRLGGGTTAVCTLLVNKKLYCSWVGDSSAMVIKRDSIVQLVNPHQLHREDEVQRIRKMGGVVMRSMGVMRVNGALSVSRAIGDVRYKPFVTSEPESRCYTLDGTEDFLIIATDGLTDFMKPAEILTILYHEINRNPNGLKRAHQICLQWAKHAGSRDNITLVVVLLTPASEIAARPANAHPLYSAQVDDILEKMNSKEKPLFLDIDDAHNAINSNILKQAIISQEPREQEDDGILSASNGKHENGDADYDYSDLGPETDVDAIDDVPAMPVRNLSYEFFKDEESSQDGDPADRDSNILDNSKESIKEKRADAENNLHDDEDKDEDEVLDEAPEVVQGLPQQLFGAFRDDIREQIEESMNDEEAGAKDEDHVDNARDVIGKVGPVDYDSPPSPQANKPLQHALIPEADNVADSEDSDDEWNYYRVDPNKEKDSATPVDELQETKNERQVDSPELPVEDIESKIQSQDIEEEEEEDEEEEEEEEIKCESPKEELSKLIDSEISEEDRALDPKLEKLKVEEEEELKDMAFQLNPDAAEFVPVSPQFMGTRMNLIEDYPISGSPLKQVPEMDDIQVPSQSEFEEEVCRRPREVEPEDKEYSNGNHLQRNDETDFMSDRQKSISLIGNLDDSEISSTKAEFGDESASFMTASEFHRTGISTVDESFSSSEREYDIAKDPMAMSFTPSDFEAAFDKGVDLNAVHNLSNTDLDEKNGTLEEEEALAESPEPQRELITPASEPERLAHTPTSLGEPAELVNLSSQQEDSDTTFIEHADEPKATTEHLDLQTESFQPDQQETTRSDHSPLTDNYSAECESEKEAVSMDNEQPLSPSSIDVDETKPIDETSEDAILPGSDLQKEVSAKEVDTPLSLSPAPDAMESDVAAKVEDPEASAEAGFAFHPDAPEFRPGSYNFHSYAMESDEICKSSGMKSAGDVCKPSSVETASDICQFSPVEAADDVRESSPMEMRDVCESSTIEAGDICQSPAPESQLSTMKTDDLYQLNSMETNSTQEPFEENLKEDAQISEEKLVEPETTQPLLQDNLLDFGEEEEHDVCVRSQISVDPTPPPTPQKLEMAESFDDLVCPIKSVTEEKSEKIVEPVEAPVETEVLEPETQEMEESVKEAALKLSDSMQEFTGLESQLQPTLEKTPEEAPVSPNVIPELQKEIPEHEELIKEADEPEKLVEPMTEKECKLEEEKKVEEISAAIKGEIPAIVETAPSEDTTILSTVEAVPSVVEAVPSVVEAVPSVVEAVPSAVEAVPSGIEAVEAVPSAIEAVASAVEAVPSAFEAVEAVPSAFEAVEAVPSPFEAVEAIPSAIEAVPSAVEALPSAVEALPSAVDAVSSAVDVVPSAIDVVPSAVEAVPPAVETVPPAVEVPPKVEEASSEVKEPEVATKAKASELNLATEAAVAAAAVTAVGAATVAAHSKPKAKLAAKPTKTTTSKTALKSTPTSPSKTVTSTTKTTTAAAKKPATSMAARPKDLDAPKKTAVSSPMSNKAPATKPVPKTTITSSSAAKPSSRLSLGGTTKPKPTATAPKAAASDKKPTTNGEVKSLSKPATTKPPVSKVSSTTKTSLVKTSTSSTRTSVGATTTTKLRSASATAISKPSTTAKPSTTTTTTTAARPKTAPTVGNTAKPRSLSAKSPIIDKQVKETANKQISMARTSTTTKTTRMFASATTTTTAKRMSSGTKTTTAASPTKKPAVASKVASKTSIGGKTTASEKGKVVQNGVSEKISTIIDDMPKKDLSPVVTSNDNQLIMSSD